ncbi:hydrophobin [Fusarium sp. NRRL 52700]|nr:hydrophobin [Fusarium sp. NRRL 52700]
MKFTASVLALLAGATGALASPHGGPPPPPPPPPPPAPKNNNNNNQGNQCGNGQSLYCCTSSGKNADVECISFTNGGLGGVCNGIQMCCNNNNGNQGCNFNVGGGTVTIKSTTKKFGW